jgi:hypothetical protein
MEKAERTKDIIKPSDEELIELAGDLSEVKDTTNRNCTYRPCGL